MKRSRAGIAFIPLVFFVAGCTSPQTTEPMVRLDVHAAYLKANAVGYEWFASASDGYGGVPLILLRALPELAPEIWGPPQEQFARFGYIGDPNSPLPLGLSWDSMDPQVASQPLHPVALTCGACHIGQVRLNDGSYMKLVGGPNTQFDVRMWRRAFEVTVHKYLSTPADVAATAERLKAIVLQKPADYFYRNARGVPSAVEAGERQYIAANAQAILSGFAAKILLGELATDKQKATSYSKSNAPPLDGGTPGQSDGSGDLLPRLLLLDTLASVGPAKTMETFKDMRFDALPDKLATVTDIFSTWQQATQNIAQADGSVRSPLFRNIAASLAVAGDPKMVNVQNAEITANFIGRLPPPLYPFGIDMAAANRGKRLFDDNCAACHKQYNDNVYPAALIGTDPNRAQVLNAAGLALFVRHFVASVPAAYEATDAQGRKYRPSEMAQSDILYDRSKPQDQGYVTNALEGLWARAPYLHNGAVPTVYQILVPSARPAKFVRGAVSYDVAKTGFDWDPTKFAAYRAVYPTAAIFDTSWDGASRLGHDTNLTIDAKGKIVRKGWGGATRDGERRVRLDWSGAQEKAALGDLLEYLKTL